MKKIVSFLTLMVLCSIAAMAQEVVGSELPADKLIKIGTAQGQLVPGKWYFVHNPRGVNYENNVLGSFAQVGETISSVGGLVTDYGTGNNLRMSTISTIESLCSEEGQNINNHLSSLIRFVAVDSLEGAYNVQFGTGNWMQDRNPNNIHSGNITSTSAIDSASVFNFYLVTIAGEENTAGRFGWNLFNMDRRVDNNGSGGTVVFWDSGEVTSDEVTSENIRGNDIWQIYDIQIVGEVDFYVEALNYLLDNYTTITGFEEGMFVDNLREGKNVGDSYGNYRKADVDAFLAIQDTIDLVMETWEFDGPEALQETYPTAADINSLHSRYVSSHNFMIKNKVPFAVSAITPGYYSINSMMNWYETKSDSVFYTQEEADSINTANGTVEGDDLYIVPGSFNTVNNVHVPAPTKSLCSRDENGQEVLAWGNQQPVKEFLWKIETVEGKPTEYRLINMLNGKTFSNVPVSYTVNLNSNDTATVCFDWIADNVQAPGTNDYVTVFNIRSSSQSEKGGYYLHCAGHKNGAGTEGNIVGWYDAEPTRWYLSPVDDATAQEWMDSTNVENPDTDEEVDSTIIGADSTLVVPTDRPLITDVSQLSSPYSCTFEGTLEGLIDGDAETYWHSEWQNGTVEGGHYLQIELPQPVTGSFSLYMMRRSTSLDHPSLVRITGSNTADFADTTVDVSVAMPNAEGGGEAYSGEWVITEPTSYLRVEALDCEQSFRGYWHAAELQIYQIGEVEGWLEDVAEEIAQLGAFPVLKEELQDAYDKLVSLPEGTPEDSVNAITLELSQTRIRVKEAQACFADLSALIALADSVLAETTDEDLSAACNDAKEITAATSGSQEIFDAFEALESAYAVFASMSVPMEEWNFTETLTTADIRYDLDVTNYIARAHIKGREQGSELTELVIPSVVEVDGKKYPVVSLGQIVTNNGYNYHHYYQKITLPSTIQNIEYYALSYSSDDALQTVVVKSNTPPVLSNHDFDKNIVKVCIPNGTINSYRLATNWNECLLVQETPVEVIINSIETGELGQAILDNVDNFQSVNKLTVVSGTLNDDDWANLNRLDNLIELNLQGCSNTVIPERQFESSRIESIVLPDNLTEVAYASFYNAKRLASIDIPNGVESIGGSAFSGCSALTSINIPNGVTSIGSSAFDGCKALSSIVIPANVKEIASSAFAYCSRLEKVTFPEGLVAIGDRAFASCDIKSVVIPSTVKSIGGNAFLWNDNLSQLTLSEGLENLQGRAFAECHSLTEVTLPSTLIKCYESPFYRCDSIRIINSLAVIPPFTNGSCPISSVDMTKVTLKVPAWSTSEYKLADGWSDMLVIEASDYLPNTINIFKKFTFRVEEEQAADYQPTINLGITDISENDEQGNPTYQRGSLVINPNGMLNAKALTMHYSPFAKYNDDNFQINNGYYHSSLYNANSLIVKGEMRAEDVTITLINHPDRWQFISFPFDVRMSDIVPVAGESTQWVIREYSGYLRSLGKLDSTWLDLTSEDVLVAGKGYIMHCHDNNNDSWNEPVMFKVTPDKESLNRQNIFTSRDAFVSMEEHIGEFDHNSSWNLVGNPYPCYFDTRFMDFTAPITVWNSRNQNYQAYSPVDDDYVLNPGEAFFVQRPAESDAITFSTEGRQVTIYPRDLEATNAREASPSRRLVFNIALTGEKTSDRTRVVINDAASLSYEMNRDASKFNALSNAAVQLYTLQGNTRMAINERPLGNARVALGMTVPADGTYTISLQKANGKTVVLEDRLLGISRELSDESSYIFNAKAGEVKGRFFLNFSNSTETGIDSVEQENGTDEPAYNTAGQRVEDTQKGILIMEGKKILNK